MANENIIRFPDSGRGQGAGASDPYLADARDLVARRLRETMRTFADQVQQDLMQQADRAEEREQRKFLMDTRDKLMERATRLEALVAAQWQREFDAVVQGKAGASRASVHGLDELSLVDDGELDEDLIIKSIGGKIRDDADEALFGVERRLAQLMRRPGLGADDHPAAPGVLGRALRGALHEAEFSGPQRLLLLQQMARFGGDLANVYRDLDSHLIGKNILPNLKRSYERERGAASGKAPEAGARQAASSAEATAAPASPAGSGPAALPEDVFGLLQRLVAPNAMAALAAGGTVVSGTPQAGGASPLGAGVTAGPSPQVWAVLNTIQRQPAAVAEAPLSTQALREFKASSAGEALDKFDAITVDIVAMLFDLVFEDKDIPDPIKALVGRLQIPVLKVAMLDKSFFSSRAHPARRLLDGISRSAIRWGQSGTHDDPLYREVARIVERVQNEFTQETQLFEDLCGELENFLSNEDKAAEAWAMRAAPLVAERDKRELAEAAAAQAVQAWRAKPVPEPVRELLENEWKALLAHYHFHDDEGGWVDAMRVGNDLVASVQRRSEAREIKALARKLPLLVKDIQSGFDRLGTLPARRFELIDALLSIHAAILRGAEVAAAPKPAEAAPASSEADAVLATRRMDDGELVVESLAIVGGQAPESLSELARRQVADLTRGDWVEFRHTEGNPRYRLSWVSPQRGVLLFTNPQSPRAIAVSPDALALQFEHGEAVPVSALPIFDRALDRALDNLKAA
ncbi:MAG: DUF1631 family protein [Rhodocyclaceae bacterium]|nr:DUF1631 family protein [Rhodocyclaceae bacterium]